MIGLHLGSNLQSRKKGGLGTQSSFWSRFGFSHDNLLHSEHRNTAIGPSGAPTLSMNVIGLLHEAQIGRCLVARSAILRNAGQRTRFLRFLGRVRAQRLRVTDDAAQPPPAETARGFRSHQQRDMKEARTMSSSSNASIAKKARTKAEADFATWLMMAKLGGFDDLPSSAQSFLTNYRTRLETMTEAESTALAVREVYSAYYSEMGRVGAAPEPKARTPTPEGNLVRSQRRLDLRPVNRLRAIRRGQ
jgi:hypothetical protein